MNHLRILAWIPPTFAMLKVIVTGSASENVLDIVDIAVLSLTFWVSCAEAKELDVVSWSLCVLSFFPNALVGSLIE